MSLVVVVDKANKPARVVHVGQGTQTGLNVTPQWLLRKMQENPASYQSYNMDHYAGHDEGVIALLWLVEDLWTHARSLELRLLRLEEAGYASGDVVGTVPREMMGGGG